MSIIGTLCILNQNYERALVNNIEIIGAHNIGHAFHNDIVEISYDDIVEVVNGKVIKIVQSNISKIKIVGTLILNSKYKYGYNKRKVEYYLFKPLSNHYPHFLVASNTREKYNQYAVIEFLRWDTPNQFPYGQIVKIIGPTDDIENTYDAIIYKNNLVPDNYKFKSKLPDDFNPITFFGDIPHQDRTSDYVFSVDPICCQDIDDALSIREDGSIGIHIADVGYYFEKLGLELPNKFSTIYAPHKNYSMIPEILANNICSLHQDRNRLAFTIWIKIDNTGEVTDYSFEKTVIRSKKAYSYEELQELIDTDKCPKNELVLYNLGKQLSNSEFYDSHKMVEAFMILANRLVGKYLYENVNDKGKTIFRVHEKAISSKPITNNPEIDSILELLESNAAVYTNNHANYYHNGLGIDFYTHFTSPIRRYVDIHVHRLLNCVITKSDISQIEVLDCDKVNEFNRNVKKAERECRKIEVALGLNDDVLVDAYVLDISNYKITIYIPAYKIVDRIRLFDRRLESLFDVYVEEDQIEIKNKENSKSVVIKKYDTVKVKIACTLYNDEIHKKIDTFVYCVHELL